MNNQQSIFPTSYLISQKTQCSLSDIEICLNIVNKLTWSVTLINSFTSEYTLMHSTRNEAVNIGNTGYNILFSSQNMKLFAFSIF